MYHFEFKDYNHEIYHETLGVPGELFNFSSYYYIIDEYHEKDAFINDLKHYSFELYGSWDNWQKPTIMNYNSGKYSCDIELNPGTYQCKLKFHDNWYLFTCLPITSGIYRNNEFYV